MKVWVGWEFKEGEGGYTNDWKSNPLVVFDNMEMAKKWKRLDEDRRIKVFDVQSHAECLTCGGKL